MSDSYCHFISKSSEYANDYCYLYNSKREGEKGGKDGGSVGRGESSEKPPVIGVR